MNNLENKEIMARNIKHYMDKSNIDRKELSIITGAAYTTVTDWIKGNSYPRIDKIEKMASFFGITKSDLVEDRTTRSLPSNIIPLQKAKKLPIVGSIAAGKPTLVNEDIEDYIVLDDNIGGDFALKVHGDSMIDANILNGDLAIIKRDCSIENGEIYAIAINNEATLKKLYKSDNSYILQPCNSNYEPIIVKEEDNPYIVGKLTAVVRKY